MPVCFQTQTLTRNIRKSKQNYKSTDVLSYLSFTVSKYLNLPLLLVRKLGVEKNWKTVQN